MKATEFPYRFEPQPDITAYELSRLLVIILRRYDSVLELAREVEALPPECRRHIAEIKT